MLVQKRTPTLCLEYRRCWRVGRCWTFFLLRSQIRVLQPIHHPYTAFTVGNLGFFECNHMPFGLCNALATFQWLMQNCLGKPNLIYCLIYLDDLNMFSQTMEEHLHQLHVVFDRLREYNLKLKPSKCSLFREEMNYLAH